MLKYQIRAEGYDYSGIPCKYYEINFTYNGETPDMANVMNNARVVYAFDARQKLFQAKDSFESRHETESFRVFNSGISAG